MRNHNPSWQRAAFVLALFLTIGASGAFGQTLKEVTKFDLPGPSGKRFDYLTIDPGDHYLISAHLAADQTYVIDLRINKVVATVTDTPGAEGVEYVSELKKFYTSNAHDNTIGVVNLQQMKVVKKLKTEAKPDGSAYAAPFHRLYVSDGRGKAEAVLDVTRDEVVKTLHFDSETGMPQYDPVAGRYTSIYRTRTSSLSSIPRRTTLLVATQLENVPEITAWRSTRSIIARSSPCKGNELMTVFDLDKNIPIAFLPLAGGPGVIKFDPGLRRIYVARYSGAISVFHEDDADHYRKLEDFHVQHAEHKVAVDLQTHRLYPPEQEEDGKPVALMVVYDAVSDR